MYFAEPVNRLKQFDRKAQEKLRVLFALMSLCGKSDREIAKTLGMSNTALSRRRRNLEEEGYIKEYAIIPDFHKIGLDAIAFTLYSAANSVETEQHKRIELLQKYPEVLCLLEDQGLTGTNWLVVSVHRNYDSYTEFYLKVAKDAPIYPTTHMEVHTSVFHTGKMFLKPFSLQRMGSLFSGAEQFQTTKPSFMSELGIYEKDTAKENTQEKLRVLFALMSLCGKSDREIAKTLGMSNSALYRKRRKLEEEGYIKEYAIIPDFHKIGLDVIAFTFSRADVSTTMKTKGVFELLQKYPETLFVLEGQGLTGTNWVGMAAHKDYDSYIEFYKKVTNELISLEPQRHYIEMNQALFHTNKKSPKPFSLRKLGLLFRSANPPRTGAS